MASYLDFDGTKFAILDTRDEYGHLQKTCNCVHLKIGNNLGIDYLNWLSIIALSSLTSNTYSDSNVFHEVTE